MKVCVYAQVVSCLLVLDQTALALFVLSQSLSGFVCLLHVDSNGVIIGQVLLLGEIGVQVLSGKEIPPQPIDALLVFSQVAIFSAIALQICLI